MSATLPTAFFDKAIATLASVGISLQNKQTATDAVLPLISMLETVDAKNALTVGRTLQMASAFNETVREQIASAQISDRYNEIANLFDSIRADTRDMVTWMADGKLDWKERISMKWMQFRRGSVNDRFTEVRDTFLAVMKDSNVQIQTERQILQAYQEFRYAMKDAEIAAQHILEKATTQWDHSKSHLSEKQAVVDAAGDNGIARSEAELARDQALHQVQQAEARYQVAFDLVNNLKVGYNTSDVVFARLQQNVDMKTRVQQQSASFFATNETTFTALSAAFTSTQGLAESTHTLNQMRAGADAALQDLATLGNEQLLNSARAGYGATISASSVAALADAIVAYQTELRGLVTELRQEAQDNANEIASINEAAKQNITALIQQGTPL